jgi:hypothetical protein
MATSADDLLGNVHDYFLNLFNTPGSSGQNAVLCFDPGGVTVSPTDFKIAPSDATYSAAKAIEEVTHLSDILPSSIADGIFNRTQRSIELLAGMIIAGATPTSADDLATIGAAKTEVSAVYDNNELRTFVGDFSYRPASATPVDWYDPSVADNWATYHFASATAPAPASPPSGVNKIHIPPLCWMTLPEKLTPILDPTVYTAVLQAPGDAPITSSQATTAVVTPHTDVQAAIEVAPSASAFHHTLIEHQSSAINASLLAKPTIADLAMTHIVKADTVAAVEPLRIVAVDSPAFESEALNSVAIQSLRQVAAAPPADDAVALNLHVARETRLISSLSYSSQVAADISAASTAQPVEAPEIEISFQHCVVRLSRPWFPELLLFTKGWYIAGYGAESFATGDLTDATALFPCIPTGFVAIKDLTIKGTWSQADTAAAAKSASLGPFSLLGSVPSGPGTYSRPGMQIFAWICEPLPPLPPDGDPALSAASPPPPANS